MDPTQSNNVVSDIDTNPTQPTQPAVPPGVQARFDEMTAETHALRRQLEAQNLAQQELITQLAANAIKANQPTQPAEPLPEGVDPTLVNYLSKSMSQVMANQLDNFKREITSALGGVRQSQEQMEVQQVASKYSPEVQKEAQSLLASWRKMGLTGWKPEDAFIYAEGQASVRARSNANRTKPNGDGSDSMVQGGGGLPPPPTRNLPPAKSDDELKKMTPGQQEAYWAGRVGNTELTY